MPIAGKITVSRVTGSDDADDDLNDDDDCVSITLIDVGAASEVMKIRMSLAGFAQALMGTARMACRLYPNHLERLGRQRQHRRELVWFEGGPPYDSKEDQIRATLARLEVDGWQASDRDALNHHNWGPVSDDHWSAHVTFQRWINREDHDG